MAKNKDTFRTPAMIFAAYAVVGCLVILGYHLIAPNEPPPLPIFTRNWRLTRILLDIIAWFPALAFSALVVPFGVAAEEDGYSRFSAELFQRLISPVVTAISAAVLYALLFLLVLPLAQTSEQNMRYNGELYAMAKERARIHSQAGEWIEASQFIGICDSVWYYSPEIDSLRAEVAIHLDEIRPPAAKATGKEPLAADVSALPGQRNPVNAAEAIVMGQAAFDEKRFFDAHWFATLGGRIAREGSPEQAVAVRLASRAWNEIENLRPGDGELSGFRLYRIKRSGYEAMVSGDWIRAYYIFRELVELSPNDPDARNFLAACARGTAEIAFFTDEIDVSPGETLTGVIFSLPETANGRLYPAGRSVLRMGSFSFSPDFAYGSDLEYMVFDSDARLLLSLRAPYAKILPITLDGNRRVLIQMRALDRHDSGRRFEPEIFTPDAAIYNRGTAQITLGESYEVFLMLSEMRQGLPTMQMGELFEALQISGETGYIPQVFEAEILNRLGSCLFFLPMTIFVIIIGWIFRVRQRPRYIFILMLPVLPLVFNGLVYLYRTGINIIGISLVMAVGFSAALTIFILFIALSFFISLILLAAQRG